MLRLQRDAVDLGSGRILCDALPADGINSAVRSQPDHDLATRLRSTCSLVWVRVEEQVKRNICSHVAVC